MSADTDSRPLPLASDALKANLLETAAPVTIHPELLLLRDGVARFQGLLGKIETLLAGSLSAEKPTHTM